MKVYVLLREEQNQHGYVDTGIDAMFHLRGNAEASQRLREDEALRQGLALGKDALDGEWDVTWWIEEHALV
jgi:hypothetical protein